jgi:hypothetical protein
MLTENRRQEVFSGIFGIVEKVQMATSDRKLSLWSEVARNGIIPACSPSTA